jgi:hypothetical protein
VPWGWGRSHDTQWRPTLLLNRLRNDPFNKQLVVIDLTNSPLAKCFSFALSVHCNGIAREVIDMNSKWESIAS